MSKHLRLQHQETTASTGFTLLEISVVLIIVGILAAMAAPGLITWKANYDVRAAANQAASTLIFFQRESIRTTPYDTQSPSASGCRFDITNTAYDSLPGIWSNNCPMGNLKFENGITIDPGGSTLSTNIKFSPVGSIILSSAGKVVLQSPSGTIKRCIQMSQPLGMIRTGTWNGTACT